MIVAALIPAAGSGRRMGCGVEKQFLELGGKPLLARNLARFQANAPITHIVIIGPPGREKYCRQEIVEPEGFRKVSHIVAGAETRQRSVTEGFRCLSGDVDVVVVHDGARPFVTPTLIRAAIAAAARDGSAIVAIPESDTLKRVAADGTVVETLDRRYLWRARNPQDVFGEIRLNVNACPMRHRHMSIKRPASAPDPLRTGRVDDVLCGINTVHEALRVAR